MLSGGEEKPKTKYSRVSGIGMQSGMSNIKSLIIGTKLSIYYSITGFSLTSTTSKIVLIKPFMVHRKSLRPSNNMLNFSNSACTYVMLSFKSLLTTYVVELNSKLN